MKNLLLKNILVILALGMLEVEALLCWVFDRPTRETMMRTYRHPTRFSFLSYTVNIYDVRISHIYGVGALLGFFILNHVYKYFQTKNIFPYRLSFDELVRQNT